MGSNSNSGLDLGLGLGLGLGSTTEAHTYTHYNAVSYGHSIPIERLLTKSRNQRQTELHLLATISLGNQTREDCTKIV